MCRVGVELVDEKLTELGAQATEASGYSSERPHNIVRLCWVLSCSELSAKHGHQLSDIGEWHGHFVALHEIRLEVEHLEDEFGIQ